MFSAVQSKSRLTGLFIMLNLIFEAAVREVRSTNSNAIIGLLSSILTSVIMIMAFYLMFTLLGLRGAPLRGDMMLFMMTGIFLFLTHTKAVGAVSGADGPTSPMMLHGPMNTIIAICGAALGSLYIQFLTLVLVLTAYHTLFNPITIQDPVGGLGMFLLAWLTGCAIGMLLLAAKPWAPGLVNLATTIYRRANMIASGKMFAANTLPNSILVMFSWNPLFHTIDQSRTYVFLNYSSDVTNISYPVYLSITFIMLGLMGEFFTRKHASASWGAGK